MHFLIILKFFKQHILLIICGKRCRQLSKIVAISGPTHFFFAPAHLVNEIDWLCNASVARLLIS